MEKNLLIFSCQDSLIVFVAALEKLHEFSMNSCNAKDQEHSRDGLRMLHLIRNKKFCPHLSALSDII